MGLVGDGLEGKNTAQRCLRSGSRGKDKGPEPACTSRTGRTTDIEEGEGGKESCCGTGRCVEEAERGT